MPTRPSWDQYFMDIAKLVSTRSTCLRRQVGAVLVKDKNIIATGYNGVARGLVHCSERGCLRSELNIPSGERHEMCRGIHAEQNAIIQAALHGVSTDKAVLYCTDQPCILCSKMLINAGITTVYFQGDYPDDLAKEMLTEAKIILNKWESKEVGSC